MNVRHTQKQKQIQNQQHTQKTAKTFTNSMENGISRDAMFSWGIEQQMMLSLHSVIFLVSTFSDCFFFLLFCPKKYSNEHTKKTNSSFFARLQHGNGVCWYFMLSLWWIVHFPHLIRFVDLQPTAAAAASVRFHFVCRASAHSFVCQLNLHCSVPLFWYFIFFMCNIFSPKRCRYIPYYKIIVAFAHADVDVDVDAVIESH